MQHELWLLGKIAVCPNCSGMVKRYYGSKCIMFYCVDCKSRFKVVSEGQTDKSFTVEQN